MEFPQDFTARERALLGARFDELYAYATPQPARGVTVNALRCTPEWFAQHADFDAQPSKFCQTAFTTAADFRPGRHAWHHAGVLYAQEPSASAPAALLDVQPGMRVADLCAAPGGKSFSAAFAMEDQGEILACDLHENKLKRIREGAERLGLACIQTTAADGRGFRPEWEARFDVVLVDAPCSGFGIIRKKPDVRYKKPDDLFALPVIQRAILDNAARYVRPGGTLVYSTCTILPEENEGVSDSFLAEHPDFCRTPFSLSGPVGETEGQVTLWPHRHGTDGFYICRMTRN